MPEKKKKKKKDYEKASEKSLQSFISTVTELGLVPESSPAGIIGIRNVRAEKAEKLLDQASDILFATYPGPFLTKELAEKWKAKAAVWCENYRKYCQEV